jgi:DNA-directed RNA polymerase specialized sigma24 family protein
MTGGRPAEYGRNGRDGGETVPLSDPEFKDQLAQVIPHLRAFGRSLSGSRDLADDLVQETLLKAWAARKRFQAGTNMRAWTFIILRNLFLSQMRRAGSGRMGRDHRIKLLAAPASQDGISSFRPAARCFTCRSRSAALIWWRRRLRHEKRPRFAVAPSARSRAASRAAALRSRR